MIEKIGNIFTENTLKGCYMYNKIEELKDDDIVTMTGKMYKILINCMAIVLILSLCLIVLMIYLYTILTQINIINMY